MTPPSKLAHVVYRTPQLDEMVRWYETVLGAHVVFRNDFICFMTYDDEHHRIALVRSPEPGVDHVAYTYADLDELLDTFERLRAQGITPYWTIDHGPTTSMYYRDPDGNQLELQIDNHADAASLHAWFQSGAFAANPIGVNIDVDELLAEHRGTR